jgi:protein phosphatase 2C family protein 2/3
MEDAHTMLLSVEDDASCQFFAVFDGHGGPRIAEYASKHLHRRLYNSHQFKSTSIEEALRHCYLDLDHEMMTSDELTNELSGTTAVSVLIKNNKLYCANVGDSRAVCSVSGHAVPLSHDHKPSNPGEQQRIFSAGGWVEFNRVNGNLALSRALGDFTFKRNRAKKPEEQIVTAFPELSVYDVSTELEFLVIACDGIWDVLTNNEVIEFCRKRIMMQVDPMKICEELMDQCLAPDCHMGGLGCDNMTVQLICFLHNQPYSQLANKCAQVPTKNSPPEPKFS